MIVSDSLPAVQQQQPTAAQDYRRHVYGNCLYCMGGHWCAVREELDYLADVEAFANAKSRGGNRG